MAMPEGLENPHSTGFWAIGMTSRSQLQTFEWMRCHAAGGPGDDAGGPEKPHGNGFWAQETNRCTVQKASILQVTLVLTLFMQVDLVTMPDRPEKSMETASGRRRRS